jgi:hypothetical protein
MRLSSTQSLLVSLYVPSQLTAAPQQRLKIHDLTIASANPAIDKWIIILRNISNLFNTSIRDAGCS